MKQSEKDRIIDRYNKRIQQYGNNINALASGTEERRNLRFQILTEIGIGESDSVLDLGCGYGDYYGYLKKHFDNFGYTGIDINPNLIEFARERYKNVDFKVMDIQNESPGESDFIVSTSCFNLKLSDTSNYDFIEDIMKSCFRTAKKGVAIDFLTSYVDFKGNEEEAFYYEPEKVFRIAKSISKRVALRHDYPLFEFCIYLYPDFKGWSK
jgi:ubiquinone/menaquinone biosynthesis C-methylase UbiE